MPLPQLSSLPLAVAADAGFDWAMLTWAVVGGLAAVVFTSACCAWQISRTYAVTVPRRFVRPRSEPVTQRGSGSAKPRLAPLSSTTHLPAAASWSFSDSWATNLTALITTTAAGAAILGKDLETVFRLRAPLAFSLTTSMMLVVAALAPVVYTVLQEAADPLAAPAARGPDDEAPKGVLHGTMLGWCASAALTLVAVEGSLSAAARGVQDVSHAAWPGRLIGYVLIVGVMVLVAVYVARSFLVLLRVVQPTSGVSLASMAGLVTVSCCADPEVATRLRVSLL